MNPLEGQGDHFGWRSEPERELRWVFLTGQRVPCSSLALLEEARSLREAFAEADPSPAFVVLGSAHPDVFSLGGDLDYFLQCIETGDEDGISRYGRLATELIWAVASGLGFDATTVSAIAGTALGGGLEYALAADFVVVERGVRLAFPEASFGLFPGMGADQLLARRLSPGLAQRLLLGLFDLTSEEAWDLGLVDVLAAEGEAESAARRLVDEIRRDPVPWRWIRDQRRAAVSLPDLMQTNARWVEAALGLTPAQQRRMRRICDRQQRRDHVRSR